MQYDNLPKELRENGKFCVWKFEERKGQAKPAKVPYQISGRRSQPDNIKTFTDYAKAINGVSQNDGIGIGVFNGFSVIDINHCINKDGTLSPLAQTIVNLFDGCYIEKSPSDTGLHIYFKASGFDYSVQKYYVNNQSIGVEVYVYGVTNRFLTVTGNVYRGGDILEAGDKLQILLDKFMLKPVKPKRKNQKPSISYLSDEEVLGRAKAAKNGESFIRLWNGEVPEGKSHSEADLALCGHLAFWCGKDLSQMDSLFRQSGLYREKWDRAQSGTTYGQITLEKAAENVSETYNPIGRFVQIESEFEVPGCKPLEELNPHRNPRYGRNDIGNSNLFADHYGSIARYVPERKHWFIYDGKA